MTAKQLQSILAVALSERGDIDVMIDIATFAENEAGTIIEIESAEVKRVQGADDSGPVGPKFPMLVLDGGFRE